MIIRLKILWEKNLFTLSIHCKFLNARFECNDIVILIYSHYSLDPNVKSSDTKCVTLSIRWFCIRIEWVMTVYWNYGVIAFRSCIQLFTVHSHIRITKLFGKFLTKFRLFIPDWFFWSKMRLGKTFVKPFGVRFWI